MLGTDNVQKLAEFYEKVFDRKPDMVQGEWYGWKVGSTFFSVGAHSEVIGNSKEPQRIIFNLETKDVKGEFERIKNVGAVVIKEPYAMGDAWIATFSDPDNNYFQLMTPWKNK
ncbi:MAG TPA: VOC family protein [Patescibacteria group bacterium]